MLGDIKQISYVANAKDNVATALCNIEPGKVRLTGETVVEGFSIDHQIQYGHKFALQEIKSQDPIIKYGSIIGNAKKDIKKGDWVHLHNCGSLYDKN